MLRRMFIAVLSCSDPVVPSLGIAQAQPQEPATTTTPSTIRAGTGGRADADRHHRAAGARSSGRRNRPGRQ